MGESVKFACRLASICMLIWILFSCDQHVNVQNMKPEFLLYPHYNQPISALPDDPALWPGYSPPYSKAGEIHGFAGASVRNGSLYVNFNTTLHIPGSYKFETFFRPSVGQKDSGFLVWTELTLPAGRHAIPFHVHGRVFHDLNSGGPLLFSGIAGFRAPDKTGAPQILKPHRSPFQTQAFEMGSFTTQPFSEAASPALREKLQKDAGQKQAIDRLNIKLK